MLIRTNIRILLLLWLVSSSSFSFAQVNATGETYAIVVGISKYRFIKPLSFADKDADLFAQLLRSGAGGNIKPQNLFLLKNDSANGGNFWSALSRINNNNLNKGDRVYIYFAGHGDAMKGLNEYYLLLSDCQPANDGNNYMLSFGAIDMYHLKNRIGLLTSKGVQVILILDACRTNELAGGYASQVFNTSVVQAKVGEITMLATGPGQVSIEDRSFGSGHGLFTYDLVDALSGRADAEEGGNKDKHITLEELQQWVIKSVSAKSEKFRVNQKPVFCCNDMNETTIGLVDSSFSIAWNNLKEMNKSNSLSPEVLPTKTQRNPGQLSDTALLALYNTFNEARNENRLWGQHSADECYEQMKLRFPNDPITEDARYTLASDFINFAQQKINLYLEGKDLLSLENLREKTDSGITGFLSDEYERLQRTVSEKWTIAGRMIEKAGKMLSGNKDSTLFYQLKPRIRFLLARGFINREKESGLNYEQALQYSLDAYKQDSTAAYTAECLGLVYAWRHSIHRMLGEINEGYEMGAFVKRSDTAMRYFKKAITLAPKWVNPYRSIAMKIYGEMRDDSALVYLHKALLVNPGDGTTYMMIGDLYRYQKPDSALYYFKKALSLSGSSSYPLIYRKMARVFLSGGYDPNLPSFKPDSVLYYSRLALSAESSGSNAQVRNAEVLRDVYLDLARVYGLLRKGDSALCYYKKVIDLFPDHKWANMSVISYYGAKSPADSFFYRVRRYLNIVPENQYSLLALAKYYDQKKGFSDSAIHYYERALRVKGEKDMARERAGYLIMAKDKNDTRPLEYFTQTLTEFPSGWRSYFNITCYYVNRGENEKAVEYLEKAFVKGLKNRGLLYSDPFISTLKELESFKRLVAKYFPG